MHKFEPFVFALLVGVLSQFNLAAQISGSPDTRQAVQKISFALKNRLSGNTDYTLYPHSYVDGRKINVGPSDWRSGFFPGILWYMYDYTHEAYWKQKAELWTLGLEQQKFNSRTHDVGFIIYNSFGNGFRLTRNPQYKNVLIQAARSLSSRYNSKVGCIRSWDHGDWQYPVIIDNMMNLELLFEASRISGDKSFAKIAESHARKTMKNHFREDGSSYHVVDYNKETGEVISKKTWQGYSDESVWARGQAWALYGFTMTYRETRDSIFLNQAEKIANHFLQNLPKNRIPYWDFKAPNIPKEPQDASAAAIAASALLELSTYSSKNRGSYYFNQAEYILMTLCSPSFFAKENTNGDFFLMHSVGNKRENKEVNVPTIYADYYFIEALVRYSSLLKSRNK